MGYFDKLKDVAGKAMNATNSFAGAVNDATLGARHMFEGSNAEQSSQQHEYPFLGYIFYPGGGIGMKTTFFEEYIEHGGDKVPYSEIRTINVTHVTNNNLTNGTAQATLMSGKTMTFAVKTADMAPFLQAVGYANDKINQMHSGESGYRYGIQGNDGTAIEIYEEYMIIKTVDGGLVSKTSKDAISFNKIETAMTASLSEQDVSFTIKIIGMEQPIQLAVPSYYGQKVLDTVSFILQRKEELHKEAEETINEAPVAWQSFSGEEKQFPLNGATLKVPAEMDLFNSYRLKFREAANEYAALAKEQYKKKVRDFDTFLMFFMEIYVPYLDKILQGGVDILIAESIWTETLDSFRTKHTNDYHMAIDDYNAMKSSLSLTDQNNQQAVDTVSGAVPTLRGGGFGFKGAMKGIAKAEAFNLVRGMAVGAIKNATQVTPAQKAEIYGRINVDNLFNRVFIDYWNVYLTLVSCLNANGKSIWLPNSTAVTQAQNIAQNLSNPNFPQEQATNVTIQILTTCPYKVDFQKLLVNKFGQTDEVSAINNYFGYSAFDDIHITG